ncbi:MAG: UDP-N-acetylmuramoyl-tripeptide--D-alanyl-D-alanine ligase [Pseudomonadota bacterium]
MSLWTLKTLADAMGGTLSGVAPETPVTGVSIDTRTLLPGEVFFAIEGVSMDGHQFVPQALEKGAAAVVVSKGEAARAVRVADVMEGMRALGRAARARIGAVPVVGVTGSVGKTGTKEMLRLAFGVGGPVHAAEKSFNNHWGVPLTLARMPQDTGAGIFEIGMNHAGEITPLTKMVRPTIAMVTTVDAVHIEFFNAVADIAHAKAEIFAGLVPGGTAILPSDNLHADILTKAAMAARAKLVTFAGSGADVRLTGYDAATGDAQATAFGETVRFRVAGGPHIARNALTVLAALKVAGRPLCDVAALAAWEPPRGRGRRVSLTVPGGEALLLDDAYNASPAAMAAAIEALARAPATRRVAILGDMRELGDGSADYHRGLAPLLVDAGARIVHTIGPMSEHLKNALPLECRGRHAATVDEFLADLPAVEAGDAVLVKASLGTGLGAVVDALEAQYGVPGRV